jgi:hypothetical protein
MSSNEKNAVQRGISQQRGRKTIISLELQISSILASVNRSQARIDRIKPVRYDIGNFIFAPSIAMNLRSPRDYSSTPMRLADDDLVASFADMTLPPWLRELLDSQLLYWAKHHAETYYQSTSWPVRGEE